jgi:hypothetical protein
MGVRRLRQRENKMRRRPISLFDFYWFTVHLQILYIATEKETKKGGTDGRNGIELQTREKRGQVEKGEVWWREGS